MQDILTADTFKEYLNQNFTIQFSPEVGLEAELVEVAELGGESPLERKPFCLAFRTTQKNEYYSQAISILKHPDMDDLPLFFSPKGPDGEGMRYEVVFS